MKTEYLEFCPRLRQIYESGQSIDRDGNPVRASGFSTLNNLRIIRELLLREQSQNTLEVGLCFGTSALTFLATMKELHGSGFHHTAIDPYQNTHWKGSSIRVIEEEGFSENFTLIEGPSEYVLPNLAQEEAPDRYDMIYVDGSHLFEDVFIDYFYAARILGEQGIILFDDCRDKHVAKVIKFIERNFSSVMVPLDLSSFDDPQKSLKKRLGNLLGIRQMKGFRKQGPPYRKYGSKLKNF